MITGAEDMIQLVGAKLLEVKAGTSGNHFVAEFDNGRTLTLRVSMTVTKTSMQPTAKLTCGYCNTKRHEG